MSSTKAAFNNEAMFQPSDINAFLNAVRFLLMLSRENWLKTTALGVAIGLIGLIPVWEITVIGRFVNQISALIFHRTSELQSIYVSTAILFILMLMRNGLQLAADGLQDELRDCVKGRLQMRILQKSFRMELSFFDHEDSYEELQRADAMLNYRTVNILIDSLHSLQSAITSIGYVVVMVSVSWWLGLVIAVAACPSLWWKIRRSKQGYIHDYSTLTPTRRRLSYFARTLTDKEFGKEVRIFGLGQYLLQSWQRYQTKWMKETLDESRREGQAAVASDLVLQVVFALAAIVFARMVSHGGLSLGSYVMILQMINGMQSNVEVLIRLLRHVYQDGMFADNLFRFLERPIQAVVSGAEPFPQPLQNGITFEHVWFRYPGNKEWALRDVSFHVSPGQTVSLVGRNGSGKTTLVKLLMGMYQPNHGRILIDGIPLLELREDELWRNMAVIFQDFTHFELTLRESIGFGDVESLDDMERIREAATRTGVHTIADDLPNGYDTLLSQTFGGADLSGGQWQKVALARTMMRDAEILILDEPTAALDPRAEYEVFEQFKDLSSGRTSFLISHRVGTARLADVILVLCDGELAEVGHHDELVTQKGEYASLFEAQAQWYRDQATGGEAS